MNGVQRWREPAPIIEATYGRRHREPVEVRNARLVRRYPDGRWETMVDTYSNLVSRITAGSRRGEYGHVEPIQPWDGRRFSVNVWRIKNEPPRWRRPAIIAASVLAGLGSIAGLGVWAVNATTDALAGKGDAVIAAGVLIGLGALALVFRRPLVEVIVRVK